MAKVRGGPTHSAGVGAGECKFDVCQFSWRWLLYCGGFLIGHGEVFKGSLHEAKAC